MMDDILKQIKAGMSMPRNMFLFNNAIHWCGQRHHSST